MKFKITEEQGDELRGLNVSKMTAEETLNLILLRHEGVMGKITARKDVVWDEITSDHHLSDKITWKLEMINDEYYVVEAEDE